MNSLHHDATTSTRGTLYQLWVAVQKCYEMFEDGQKVLVETQGDVTKMGEEQIEVKQYSDSLTDNHLCFWKTLKNWMQDAFDPKPYNSLILFTTQEFASRATITDWNDKNPTERLEILEAILKKSEAEHIKRIIKTDEGKSKPNPSEALKFQRVTLNQNSRNKLKYILERFYIEASSPRLPDLYKRIKGQYLKGILEEKQDNFLNSLFGFVTKPNIQEGLNWEISYKAFCAKVGELTEIYRKGTRIFPTVNISGLDEQKKEEHAKRLFVQKIHDIEYSEVIPDAINDYQKAIKTIRDEFKKYSVPVTRTEKFTNDIVRKFETTHRLHSRNCSEVVRDSQNFFDKVMLDTPNSFPGFDDTPSEFRNGLLHSELDDENKNLNWRLVTDE